MLQKHLGTVPNFFTEHQILVPLTHSPPCHILTQNSQDVVVETAQGSSYAGKRFTGKV